LKKESLYLIDAYAYLHRAYHALPPLSTKSGEPVGALYGFARLLLSLSRREKPRYMAVCFDSPGPTFRHQAFKGYKATRKEIDEALKSQLARAEELVRSMSIPTVRAPGYEADDLLATLARRGEKQDLDVVIVSGDKDALQLVGGCIRVLNEAKNVLYDEEKVLERYKVSPRQFADYLAILGDVSDNVPGVPGIGEVGAAKLLSRFKNLDALLEAARSGHKDVPPKAAKALVENEAKLRLSRELVELRSDAPVPLEPRECGYAIESSAKLIEAFTLFEFKSLLKELGVSGSSVPEARMSASRVGEGADGAEPAPAAMESRLVAPAEFLKASRKANGVALWVERQAQEELLQPAGPVVTLALEDGRSAVFADRDFERHKTALAELLSSEDIPKIGHDLKACQRLLGGLRIAGAVDDTLLAAYCLDPSRGTYPLARVAEEYAGLTLPSGPGQAAALWPLRSALLEKLRSKGLEKLYRDVEMPFWEVLARMEAEGIALDAAYLRELGREFADGAEKLRREIDALAGFALNPNSPKQLAEFFFEKLGLPVIHKTKKGGRSTDEEALTALAVQHPIPAKILAYRELAKLRSTYVDALLERMDPAFGRVRTTFNQAGTATGRLSSADPNLQNIPVRTPHGRKIRRAFVAGKGQALLSADYSQIDLRVLAHLSGDPALVGSFEKGEDVHLRTASEVFGVPPEKVTPEMRRQAKAVNFGIVYGQSAHGLSVGLGIARGEAAAIIERYFARYGKVEAFIRRTLEEARRDGCVKTLLGRIRYLPEIASKNMRERTASERIAVNTPIQGGSADIIKAAMLSIHGKLSKDWPRARMLLQVHDELIFELPKAEAAAFGKWVRREMETAFRLRIPVQVSVSAGPNWDAMEDLD
jgi:DNA polymerase-1